MNIDELDESVEIVFGKEFTYETLLLFLKENYPEEYDIFIEEYEESLDDYRYLIGEKNIGGMKYIISEETSRIILGFAVEFDKHILKAEPDGSFFISTAVNFKTAYENAVKQFGGNDAKMYCGCTMWG